MVEAGKIKKRKIKAAAKIMSAGDSRGNAKECIKTAGTVTGVTEECLK